MAGIVLEIKNCKIVRKKKNATDVIVNIDELKINRGNSVFIMGNNGSGKSTLIKALFSLRRDDDYFFINNDAVVNLKSNKFAKELSLKDIRSEREIRDSILGYTYIEQEEYFRNSDSVIKSLGIIGFAALKHVKDGFENYGQYQEKLAELNKMVKDFSLEYFEDIYEYDPKYLNCDNEEEKKEIAFKILNKKKAVSCSGGQKKLISLLASLIKAQLLKTDLIVLDEPFNHLDHKNKIRIRDLISSIRGERKKEGDPVTFVIVSHCLIFDFIKEDDCVQYRIKDRDLLIIPMEKKIFHDCLLSEECR